MIVAIQKKFVLANDSKVNYKKKNHFEWNIYHQKARLLKQRK